MADDVSKKYALNITGKPLEIKEMKEVEVVITGAIKGIEYAIRSINQH